MSIIRRAARENPYAQIVRAMLEDRALSIDTRGMLALLLSRPPGWEVRAAWLERACCIGSDRRQRMMREAIARGYVRRVPSRDRDTGRVQGWDYEVTDAPATDRPVTRPTGEPSDGSPASLLRRESHQKGQRQRRERGAVDNSPDDDSALRALEGYGDDIALALRVPPHVAQAWTLDIVRRAGSAAAVLAALERSMPRIRAGDAGLTPQAARGYLEKACLGQRTPASQRTAAGTAGAHAGAIVAGLRGRR